MSSSDYSRVIRFFCGRLRALFIVALFTSMPGQGIASEADGFISGGYRRLLKPLSDVGAANDSADSVGILSLRYRFLKCDWWYLRPGKTIPDHWTASIGSVSILSPGKSVFDFGPVLSHTNPYSYTDVKGPRPEGGFTGLGVIFGVNPSTSLHGSAEWKVWSRLGPQTTKIDGESYEVRSNIFHTFEANLTWMGTFAHLRLKAGQMGSRKTSYPTGMFIYEADIPTIQYVNLTPVLYVNQSLALTASVHKSSHFVSAEEIFYATGYRYLEYAQDYAGISLEWTFGG